MDQSWSAVEVSSGVSPEAVLTIYSLDVFLPWMKQISSTVPPLSLSYCRASPTPMLSAMALAKLATPLEMVKSLPAPSVPWAKALALTPTER